MTKFIRTFALLAAAAAVAIPAAAANSLAPAEARTAEKVRKEIVTLPFYSIFDHITFRLDEGVVTLQGVVHRPSLRKSAERVASNVEGVREVVNSIEILPLSTHDDRIRLAVARAVFNHPGLDRYALGAMPPIHIVVRNGDVTLEGRVNREMDRNIAGIMANGVAGVFSVTNNLRVDRM